VPESEKDDEEEHEAPTRIVEDGDEGHENDGDQEDHAAPFPEKGVGDMTAVQLSNGEKVEGGDEETYPSGISNGMEDHVVGFRNLAQHDPLKEGEKEGVCQAECSFPDLRGWNDLGKSQADDNGRDAETETRQGSSGTGIEKRFPRGDRAFHTDDGTQGPEG